MKKLLISSSGLAIVVMAINFLFKIYLSYHISKEELGVFYTFMDFVSMGVLVFSGYKDSLIRAYDKQGFQNVMYWYTYSFWGLFGCVLLVELFYFERTAINYSPYWLIGIFFMNVLMIFVSYLNAAYKAYRIMLFENLVLTVGLIVSFIVFYSIFENIYALMSAFVFSFAVKTVFILYRTPVQFVLKKSHFDQVRAFFKQTLMSGLMYFFSGVFISMSGVVLLNLFGDKTILSEYQVVVKSIFFSLVAIFVFPLNTFTFPQLSALVSQNQTGEIKRIEKKLALYLSVFFVLLLLSTFVTEFAIDFVFPAAYAQSYKMLNILLPLLPFIAYTTFAVNILKGFDRFDLALYIRMAGSIVFFIAVYLLYIFGYDAVSVVYSLDLSFAVMFILAYFFKRKVLQ